MRHWIWLAVVGCAVSSDRRESRGSDLEGFYQVVDRAVADGNCAATPTPAVGGDDWFEVEVRTVGNRDSLVLTPCGDADCSSLGEKTYFDDFDDFDASGVAQLTSFNGSSCTLEWHENTLEELGGTLRYTKRVMRVSDVDGVDLDDCFAQHDDWSGAQPCVQRTVLTAELAR